jgi:hypothetical protein
MLYAKSYLSNKKVHVTDDWLLLQPTGLICGQFQLFCSEPKKLKNWHAANRGIAKRSTLK